MSTWPTTLYVDKRQPVFSSALVAWGLARLVHGILDRPEMQTRVTLSDQGSYFCVAIPSQFALSEAPYIRLLRQIRTTKQYEGLADDAFDYEELRQRERDYFAARESLRKEGTSLTQLPEFSERRKQIEGLRPRPEWQIITMINQMGALSVYNDVAAQWQSCKAIFPELLQVLLTAFSRTPNCLDEAAKQWKHLQDQYSLSGEVSVSTSQTINPDQGKGANRPKADALTIGKLSSFWLLEVLKFAGSFEAAAHYIVRGSKDSKTRDRKTYVALPRELELSTHRKIFDEFRVQLWPTTAVKLDILATLRYCQVFIQQWEAAQSTVTFHPRPNDYVVGFATAYYKDLGNAVAAFNLAQMALPQWRPELEDVMAARKLREVLDEYINVLSQLDERHGEEEEMLHAFREFLSSRDPSMRAFFDFTGSYAVYLIQRLIRQPQLPTRQLTTTNLEVIVMSTDTIRPKKPMRLIVQSLGFQHVAEAIRRSTVIPQRLKSKGERTYEVRYGLADELRRHARYPDKFLQVLSDFVQSYNQENARIYEREHRQLRKDVTADDLEQVIALMDEYDATTVAHLLIAFGYARDPKDRQDQPTAIADTNDDESPAEDQ
jgi:hypothetical protein